MISFLMLHSYPLCIILLQKFIIIFFLTHVYALPCLYKISTKKTEANIQSMYVSFCLFEHLWLIFINLTSH